MKELTEEERAKLKEIHAECLHKGVLIGSIQFMKGDTTWVIYLSGTHMGVEPHDEQGESRGPVTEGSPEEIMQSIFSAEFAAQTLASHFQEIRDGAKEAES